ncbi:TRAP-type mannitol/chloroaromatic compound transport system, small permease component [Ruegeria sp. THAF57]|uniref:TRAP transporter small permease subunit n=1 Tax=Ruegeria sp. THAF57 TaxID=2744555 RepID=UPI001771E31B|nr:TRAP transporter small permease subunit [Ruegeria sp. THAF57]CAD0187249.1 TRAP-type mannitol/chloroaromatic compound transport system, small permease component [Ruegeria sp. THAF57]
MRILRVITNLNVMIGQLVSLLIWAGIVVLCFEVVARYGFGQPTLWAHGYTQRIFGSYFVLIGAYTLIRKDHVRVDIVLNAAGPRGRALLDLMNYLFLILWGVVLTREGWLFVLDAWQFNEMDDSALGHPMWPPKLALFLGSLLITLQGIVYAIEAIVTFFNPAATVEGPVQ